ncbi:hypothetical protein HXX76_005272 [Chlamydomonas incerta]|uniref:TRP C-terminal domain-containing protein n=1 Tax=Chlamydomonas incerta TaxID=51695 RepID=A0A835T4D8_CHLIN|nr:hypothetical protein HXX76_005272 [Chlamydomonas incerta]|eukprot:KAG2438727.1 hypothetical protein HXX76_005272 [Chlamydomonas incerta]
MSAQSLPIAANSSVRPQRTGHSALIWRRSGGTAGSSVGGNGSSSGSSGSAGRQLDMFIVFGGSVYNRSAPGNRLRATSDVLAVQLDDDPTATGDPEVSVLYMSSAGAAGTADADGIVPRSGAASAVVDSFLWVFGGLDQNNTVLNDTWRFNLNAKSWTKISTTGVTPGVPNITTNAITPGLHRASMIPSSDGRFLIMYGGRGQPAPATQGSAEDPGAPQNGLWVLDTNATGGGKRATWFEVKLNKTGLLLPGYDTALALVGTNSSSSPGSAGTELMIVTQGALNQTQSKQSSATTGTSLASIRPWITVARTETGGRFEEVLRSYVGLLNSSASAIKTTINATVTLTAAFMSADFNASSAVLMPAGSPFSLRIRNTSLYSVLPQRLTAVRDAALAITPSGEHVFVTGGTDVVPSGNGGSGSAMARPIFYRLDVGLGVALDCVGGLSPAFPPGVDPTADGGSPRYTSAVHIAVPASAAGAQPSRNSLTNTLWLMGSVYESTPDDTPDLNNIDILDIDGGDRIATCSIANEELQGRCTVRELTNSTSGRPNSRLGAAMHSIYQVFQWFDKSKRPDVVPLGVGMVLMYGGQGNPFTMDAQDSGADLSDLSYDAIEVARLLGDCDKDNELGTLAVNTLASCSAPDLRGYFTMVADNNSPPPDWTAAPPPGESSNSFDPRFYRSAATEETTGRRRSLGQKPQRRRLDENPAPAAADKFSIFGDAFIAFYINSTMASGVIPYVRASKRNREAVYFDRLEPAGDKWSAHEDGSTHSPGTRAGATISGLPSMGDANVSNADVLLFGGMSGPVDVTNDIHYLQFLPYLPDGFMGLEDPDPEPRFVSCPFHNKVCLADALAAVPYGQDDVKWGNFTMRLYASVDVEYTRAMGMFIWAHYGIESPYENSHAVDQTALGATALGDPDFKCCAGNLTAGAFSYETAPFQMPVDRFMDVYFYSGLGLDWTSPLDYALGCDADKNTSACPRIELYSVDMGRPLDGYGSDNAWDDIRGYSSAPPGYSNPGEGIYKYTELVIACALPPPPPSPPTPPRPPAFKPDNLYPLHPLGKRHRLRSFEIKPVAYSELPPARHRHAATFVDTSAGSELGSMAKSLGYGNQGLLIIYGGTTEPDANAADPDQVLDDMWAFSLEHRKWILMESDGDDPGHRMRATMRSYNSVIFLTGGYTFDAFKNSWVSTSDVYYMDLRFGFNALWTKIRGNSRTISTDTNPGWLTEGGGIDVYSKRFVAPNKQMLVYVPLPVTVEVEDVYRRSNPSSGSSAPSSASVDVGLLAGITSQLYDGDLLLLPQTVPIRIATNITVSRAVLLHGRINIAYASPPPPRGGSGRHLLTNEEPSVQDLNGFAAHEHAGSSNDHGAYRRVLVGRVELDQSEVSDAQLQAMLTSPDPSMLLEHGPESEQLVAENRAAAFQLSEHVRRVLQQQPTPAPGASASQAPIDVVTPLLAINRTLVICETNGTWEISDSVFQANGNSPPSSVAAAASLNSNATSTLSQPNGGAIYLLGPGACLKQIARSYFVSNGRRAGAQFSGGAIFARYADGCDISVEHSVFSNNLASGSGGAVYVNPVLISRNTTVTNTSFLSNVAGADGGALYVSSFVGMLNFTNVTVSGNAAGARGGGMVLDEVTNINVVGLQLTSNSASTGIGGGLAMRLGTATVRNSNIRGNQAYYGGGVGAGNGLHLSLADVTVAENTAAHAGGVECYQCADFTATRVSFVGNRADSAGALSLLQVEQGGEVKDCDFISNTGRPANAATLSEAGCSRDTQGGGGAVCVTLRRPVKITGGSMNNNSAVSGGALYVQQRCILGEDEAGCGPLLMTATSFRDNTALGGGGGVVFRSWHNLTNVTCAGATAPLPPQQLSVGCSEWVNNTARYGPNAATNAYYIKPGTTSVRQYRSNDRLNMTVVVLDYHNQTIVNASREASTNLEMWYNPASKTNPFNATEPLLTGNSITAAAGVGIFGESLRVSAKPSNYSMLLSAPKTLQQVAPVEVTVEVRYCYWGEVTNKDEDQCYPCEPGTFSVNPQNFTCDSCPEHANCTVLGYPWITLPEEGFWKSGPYSPNVVECAVEDACKGTDTWNRQGSLSAYLVGLGNNYGAVYNVSEFWAMQCAEGYYGNLCGRCVAGWGQKTNGECGQCASRAANIVYYILSNFVNIIIIALTVMSQLPESVTAQKRQKRIADYIAHKHLHDADAAAQHPLQLTGEQRVNTIARKDGAGGDAPPGSEAQGADGEKLHVAASMARGGADGGAKPDDDEHSHLDFNVEVEPEDERDVASGNDNVDPEAEEGPYKGGNYAIVWKILISYLQVTAMVRKIAFVWPGFIMGLLASAKQVANTATTIVSVDCCLVEDVTPISIQRTLITIFTPFVILGLAMITWLLIFWWKKRKVPTLPFMLWLWPRLVITIIAIIFNAYPDLVTAFVELFSCQQIDDPGATEYAPILHAQGSFWSSDPNLECYVNPHLWLAMAIGIPGLVLFAAGCPLFSYYWLRRHKTLLYGSTKRSKNFAIAYSFMYEDYSERAYFWDSMIMLRKLAVIIVITFLEPISPQLQILTALGVIIIALVAQMLVHPYKNARMNYMERLSLWATMAMLYCALYFSSGDVPQAAKTAIGSILLVFNILVVAYFVLQYLYEYILGWLYLMDEKNDNDGNFTWEDVHTFLRDDHPKFYNSCHGCISCLQSCCLSIYHCMLPCYTRWRAFTGNAPPGTPADALGRLPSLHHNNMSMHASSAGGDHLAGSAAGSMRHGSGTRARHSVGSRQGSGIGAHYGGSRQGSASGRLHPRNSLGPQSGSQQPHSAPDQQLMQSVPSVGTGSHRLARASNGAGGSAHIQPQMVQQWGAAANAALGSAPPSSALAVPLPSTNSGIVAMSVDPDGPVEASGAPSAAARRVSEGASGVPPLPPRPPAPAPAPVPPPQLQASGEVDTAGVVVHVDT